ncbi:hypothetical protein M426DRAFT_245042 [Hypoxylon sp. CI-4A]|nr:hypothetical protein M426DRAFT_245042 [Hypoxylon sp. CI-4A]
MGRCDICASLTVEEIRSRVAVYHPNLRSLRDGAAAGCDMCQLCWESLRQGNKPEEINAVLAGNCPEGYGDGPVHDERVWLTGLLSDKFRGRGTPGAAGATKSDNSSHVDVECGNRYDTDLTVSPLALRGQLDVFADPGTPAASRFIERYFTASRNPHGYIEFARALLNVCRKNHPECRSDADTAPEMPTRIIDVGSSPGFARLVLPRDHGFCEPYLALSYCWGQGVKHATELNDGNLSTLLEYIDEDEAKLTATHRECFAVARQLGIRYIWIDSLCIIQGNAADWERESKRMAEVYGNAALTIIAARSADSRLGFAMNGFEPRVPPCPLPFGEKDEQGRDISGVYLCLHRKMGKGPLHGRGWCFQEGVLSQRQLIFENGMVCFSCQRSKRYENGDAEESDKPRTLLFQGLSTPNALSDASTGTVSEDIRTQMLSLWYKNFLWNYTVRQLTNPYDIFAAISGIAQLAQHSIKSRYLAGLWEDDMVRGLLWHTWFSFGAKRPSKPGVLINPAEAVEPKRPKDWDGNLTVRAPSWSWASIQGQVHERSTYRDEAVFRDPANYLIRPKSKLDTADGSTKPTWSAPGNPHCDADVLHMPVCELCFLGRPKRVRCLTWSQPKGFAGKWQVPPGRKRSLASQGYMALLEPAESEYPHLEELGLLPKKHLPTDPEATNDDVIASPALIFAEGFFDVVEDRSGITNYWFLPLLKEKWTGLLLHRDPSNGKFRRLGLAVVSRLELLPWITSGPEEEICLV